MIPNILLNSLHVSRVYYRLNFGNLPVKVLGTHVRNNHQPIKAIQN